MIWIILILVLGIIVYLYYNHLDNSTKDVERDFAIANEHYKQGEYSKAVAVWSQALEKQPKHYQLWNNRGEALYQLGKFEEALSDFKKSIELYPGEHNNPRAYGNAEKAIQTIGKLR